MNEYIYSIDTFVGDHCLNAGYTNSLIDAYRCFTDHLDLIECGAVDSVVLFKREDDLSLEIIAIVD